MARFNYGELFITAKVNDARESDRTLSTYMAKCLGRFLLLDWGEVTKEERAANNEAVRTGVDDIIGKYPSVVYRDIYIVTDWDRNRTTIMFKEEYKE